MEAQLLAAHVLGVTRTQVLAGLVPDFGAQEEAEYRRLVARRAERIPMAYLMGSVEFYGLPMEVTSATLIPRPETEVLVEVALSSLASLPHPVMLDVCTGSGCVAVACAVHVKHARVVATDLSEDAIQVALRNCHRHGVIGRVSLVVGDLTTMLQSGRVDVMTANPPYIPTLQITDLQPEIRDHEPRVAVDGGPDGLSVVRRVIADGQRVLRGGGMLAMEVAAGQAEAVEELMIRAGYENTSKHADLSGILRVVQGVKPSEV